MQDAAIRACLRLRKTVWHAESGMRRPPSVFNGKEGRRFESARGACTQFLVVFDDHAVSSLILALSERKCLAERCGEEFPVRTRAAPHGPARRLRGVDGPVIPAPSRSAHPSRASMARVRRSLAAGRRARFRPRLDLRPSHLAGPLRPSLVQRDPNAHGRGRRDRTDPARHARCLPHLT
jgi:hypothetical protein